MTQPTMANLEAYIQAIESHVESSKLHDVDGGYWYLNSGQLQDHEYAGKEAIKTWGLETPDLANKLFSHFLVSGFRTRRLLHDNEFITVYFEQSEELQKELGEAMEDAGRIVKSLKGVGTAKRIAFELLERGYSSFVVKKIEDKWENL